MKIFVDQRTLEITFEKAFRTFRLSQLSDVSASPKPKRKNKSITTANKSLSQIMKKMARKEMLRSRLSFIAQ